MVPNWAPLLPSSSPSIRTESPALRNWACRSGTRNLSTKFCAATVATVSPARITDPAVTGTFKTRPEVGASTLPSVTCCWSTERSAVRDFSALEATLKAVRASSRRVLGMVPRENRSSARVRSVCAWANWASRPAICASSDFICSASFSSPMVATTCPCLTPSPSFTASSTTVPPLRAGAGTKLALSTVANTAFSSATVFGATTKVSCDSAACAYSASAAATTRPIRIRISPQLSHANLAAPVPNASRSGRAIDPIERTHELARLRATDRIPDGLPVAPRRHQSVLAQQGQVLRHGRVADFQQRRQFTHRALFLSQLADDDQAVAVGERLEQPTRLVRRGQHVVDLYFHSCVYTNNRIYSQDRRAGIARRPLDQEICP